MRPGPRAIRPGGINRNPFVGDYVSDFLTNYELGWKTRFADDRLQFNGAVFLEEWDDIQVSFQGANGITQVDNGPQAGDPGHRDAARLAARPTTCRHRHRRSRITTASSRTTTATSTPPATASSQRAGGNAVAGHAGLQGQPDRALHVPAGRIRCARAGSVRLPGEPCIRSSTSTDNADLRGHPVEHTSSTSRSASKTTSTRSSSSCRTPRTRMPRST